MRLLVGSLLLVLLLGPPRAAAGDCNQNGIDDAIDIAVGASVDPDATIAAWANAPLSELVPDRFDFQGGETGTGIQAIGIFSSPGNMIETAGGFVPYTAGQVVAGDAYFGSGSRYATLKRDGLFLLLVTDYDLDAITVRGNIAADRYARVETRTRSRWFNGFGYRMATRSVYNNYLERASVHHLWLVPGTSAAVHVPSPSAHAQRDGFEQLGAGRVLVYALTARIDGLPMDDGTFSQLSREILAGIVVGSADCNQDGIPDECQLGPDHNQNLTRDECEPDCDESGLPDDYEIAAGLALDCDVDGQLDTCQIAAGADDCDGNGLLDACELAQRYRTQTLIHEPVTTGSDLTISLDDLPVAAGEVLLTLTAMLKSDMWLNGQLLATADQLSFSRCVTLRNYLAISADEFNALVPDGLASFKFTTPPETGNCRDGFARIELDYLIGEPGEDCNQNGVLDSCEIALEGDCDADGRPDACTVTRRHMLPARPEFTFDWPLPGAEPAADDVTIAVQTTVNYFGAEPHLSILLNGFRVGTLFEDSLVPCGEGGLSGEIAVDAATFNGLLYPHGNVITLDGDRAHERCSPAVQGGFVEYPAARTDCDADGVPDTCQLDAVTDANGNGRLDRCEPDCNQNGIPDTDEIADGTVPDCNANSVPDTCELAVQPSIKLEAARSYFTDNADRFSDLIPDQLAIEYYFDGVSREGVLERGGDMNSELGGIAPTFGLIAETASGFGPGARRYTEKGPGWYAVTASNLQTPMLRINGRATVSPGRHTVHRIRNIGLQGTPVRVYEQLTFGGDLPAIQEVTVFPNPGPDLQYTATPDLGLLRQRFEGLLPGQSVLYLLWVRDSETPLEQAAVDAILGDVFLHTLSGRDDCDGDNIPDDCQLSPASDVNGDGLLDRCQPDCNGNGLPDAYEIANQLVADCDNNGLPDGCDLANGTAFDVDLDGQLDVCQVDCNENQLPDAYEFTLGQANDCNGNGIPDECDVPRHRNVRSRLYRRADLLPPRSAAVS